nr:hypothetical protein [Actinomycetes bacterium]
MAVPSRAVAVGLRAVAVGFRVVAVGHRLAVGFRVVAPSRAGVVAVVGRQVVGRQEVGRQEVGRQEVGRQVVGHRLAVAVAAGPDMSPLQDRSSSLLGCASTGRTHPNAGW